MYPYRITTHLKVKKDKTNGTLKNILAMPKMFMDPEKNNGCQSYGLGLDCLELSKN